MVELIIYLSSQQLCIDQLCHKVVVGCAETPTEIGEYEVDKILLNPKPISPTGRQYSAAKLGGKVITLKNTNIAVHGWDEILTETMCSNGCIRVDDAILNSLVYQYLYNKIIIVE